MVNRSSVPRSPDKRPAAGVLLAALLLLIASSTLCLLIGATVVTGTVTALEPFGGAHVPHPTYPPLATPFLPPSGDRKSVV